MTFDSIYEETLHATSLLFLHRICENQQKKIIFATVLWRIRLMARTPPSHGGYSGSNPGFATNFPSPFPNSQLSIVNSQLKRVFVLPQGLHIAFCVILTLVFGCFPERLMRKFFGKKFLFHKMSRIIVGIFITVAII